MRHKLKIFKVTAIPTLLHASEVWTPAKDEIQRLESWQYKHQVHDEHLLLYAW